MVVDSIELVSVEVEHTSADVASTVLCSVVDERELGLHEERFLRWVAGGLLGRKT